MQRLGYAKPILAGLFAFIPISCKVPNFSHAQFKIWISGYWEIVDNRSRSHLNHIRIIDKFIAFNPASEYVIEYLSVNGQTIVVPCNVSCGIMNIVTQSKNGVAPSGSTLECSWNAVITVDSPLKEYIIKHKGSIVSRETLNLEHIAYESK